MSEEMSLQERAAMRARVRKVLRPLLGEVTVKEVGRLSYEKPVLWGALVLKNQKYFTATFDGNRRVHSVRAFL